MANHGRRLGRGLGALFPTLPENDNNVTEQQTAAVSVQQETTVQEHNGANNDSDVSRETSQLQTERSSQQRDKSNTFEDDATADVMHNVTADGSGLNSEQQHSESRKKDDVSRETSKARGAEKKNSRKRPTMPSLADSVHPSNMFFGNVGAAASGDNNMRHGIDAVITDEQTQATSTSDASSRNVEVSEVQTHDVSRETQASDTSGQVVQGAAVVKEPLQDVTGGYLTELRIHDIVPNAKQPRTIFDEDDLDELSRSISEVGILQPIVVRPRVNSANISAEQQTTTSDSKSSQQKDVHYELIMGERRWRASQRAGLDTIPAIVRTTSDGEMLREALLENLQRVALNPLEEAAAYQQMLDEFGITQAQLSKSVSKSRPQIANTLRLLQLPASVQKRVASGVLSAGHARALLSLGNEEQMEELANRIVAEGLSVRSTEEIVSLQNTKKNNKKKRPTARNIWAGTETLQRLEDHFNTTVMIRGTKKRGKIEINFASEEDFQRILDLLNNQQSENQEWK